MSEKNKVRLTLDLKHPVFARIEELARISGANSKSELVRDALHAYDYLIRRMAKGDKVCIINKDGVPENVVFFTLIGADE